MVKNVVAEKTRPGDLLSVQPVKAVVKSRWFPGVFQVLTLVVYLSVIALGFFGAANQSGFLNPGAFLVWVIWWPALVFVVLFAARSWCTICPLRLVSQKTDSSGLNLRVPKFIKKHRLTIALGVFLLHSAIVSFGVDDVGWLTAVYFLILLCLPLIVSLLFEPDSFCQSFCLVSGFIGSYAKLSPTELRAAEPEVCKKCHSNACLENCPSDLYMGTLDNNETCLLCFDCVKNCPSDNIRFSWRTPLKDLWASRKQSSLNALIVILLLGFMIEEVGEEWELIEQTATAVPRFLTSLGIPGSIYGYNWLDAVWLNLALPLAIIFGTAIVARLLVGKGKIFNYATTYVWGFTPLIFSLHLGKMVHRLNDNLGFASHALTNQAAQMSTEQIASFEPAPMWMGQTLEGLVIFALVTVGLLASFYVIYRLSRTFKEAVVGRRSAIAFYFTTALSGAVFLSTISHWFALG